MATLKHKIEASSYSTEREIWELINGLEFSVFYGKNTEVCISSDTGDVTDQIFERFINLEKYCDMKLIPLSCYFIAIQKDKVIDFMRDVEKVNASSLKQGKCY